MSSDRQNKDLEWIRFREETLGTEAYPEEGAVSKFSKKFKENPLVPIGCMVTLGALTYGLWSFRQGKVRRSQMMMRLRVGAQGFTVIALLGGVLLAGSSK